MQRAKAAIKEHSPAAVLCFSVLWFSTTLPFAGWSVACIGFIIAALVAWRTNLSLWLAPIVIGLLDLTPWSGCWLFNEFDVFLCCALGTASTKFSRGSFRSVPRMDLILVSLLGLSIGIGIYRSFSLADPADLSFTPYETKLNALRVSKAAAYASLFALQMAAMSSSRQQNFRLLSQGMTIGLLLVGFQVVLERIVFLGGLGLNYEFRSAGPFSEMHVGGAFLDLYLVAAAPFAIGLWVRSNAAQRTWITVAMLLGLYAIFATVSRAPVIVLITQLLLIGFTSMWQNRWKQLGVAVVLCLAALAGLSYSSSLVGRFSTALADIDTRVCHWRAAINSQSSWEEILFGSGSGSYVRSSRSNHPTPARGTYAFHSEQEEEILSITGGKLMYWGQYLPVRADESYRLTLTARRRSRTGQLNVCLCKKSVLYSFESTKLTFTDWPAQSSSYLSKEAVIESPLVSHTDLRFANLLSPVALSFSPSDGAKFDISEISLIDSAGRDLVVNGRFADGHDRWWWTSDDHLFWHAKNLFLHLYVEHGILGIVVWTMCFMRWGYLCVRNSATYYGFSILGSSLLGLILVGCIDSALDSPRIAFLFLTVGCAIVMMASEETVSKGDKNLNE